MFCSKCGSVNPDQATFCSTCGSPIPVAPVVAQSAPIPAPTPYAAPPSYPAAGPYAATGQPVSPHWLPNPGVTYAGFWLRFVAYLVDGLIVGIPVAIVAVLVVVLGGLGSALHGGIQEGGEPSPQLVGFIVMTVLICVGVVLVGGWLYYAYFESSAWQGTPGKKMMNLIVTDLNGNPITFGRASGRFFSRILTELIPLKIGYILAGVTEKKQALHDMIASCLVLRKY